MWTADTCQRGGDRREQSATSRAGSWNPDSQKQPGGPFSAPSSPQQPGPKERAIPDDCQSTPRTRVVDRCAGVPCRAPAASERPAASCARQQEQSREVFCPGLGKNARRPASSSDCRCLGGGLRLGKRAPGTNPLPEPKAGVSGRDPDTSSFYHRGRETGPPWLRVSGAF